MMVLFMQKCTSTWMQFGKDDQLCIMKYVRRYLVLQYELSLATCRTLEADNVSGLGSLGQAAYAADLCQGLTKPKAP